MGLRKNKSLLDQAGETMSGYVEQVRPQVEAAVATAAEKAGPVIADARDRARPVIADARDRARPMIADAREKAGPAIASGAAVAAEKIAHGASLAADKAALAAESAADRVAQVADPPKKRHRLRKFMIFTGLAAGIAFVAAKLRGKPDSANWQSSYTPAPAPAPRGDVDPGGATPSEAISDQAEAPHAATTPDQPAEVIDVDERP